MQNFDVTAIGNALVDFLCSVDDQFITNAKLEKGGFCLIDINQAKNLYNKMGPAQEISGGSAANTIAALSQLGCKTGFVGSIAQDQVGEIFAHDIRSIGVDFNAITHESSDNNETGRCYILVSSDAQRTMCTYLGVAGYISENKINADLIKNSRYLYVEGYMWVIPETKTAIIKCLDIAHQAGQKTAFTLSDVFCVEAYRQEFLDLIDNKIDVVFANENEIMALYQKDSCDEAIECAKKTKKLFAITRGEHGSVIVEGDKLYTIKAIPPEKLVDTTGAGDAFAAGFLYGLCQNMSYSQSAEIGSLLASEVISHIGARAEADLNKMVLNFKKAS